MKRVVNLKKVLKTQWDNFKKDFKISSGLSFIIKFIIGISITAIPILIGYYSNSIQERMRIKNSFDKFYDDAFKIESAYRNVRNYLDDICENIKYDEVLFRQKITELDYNIISYYMKSMMLFPEISEKADSVLSFIDQLYWGKDKQLTGELSFRKFIFVTDSLYRNDQIRFGIYKEQIKELSQFYDDILHLSILLEALRIYSNSENIEYKFKKLKDDINNHYEKGSFRKRNEYVQKMKQLIKRIRNLETVKPG